MPQKDTNKGQGWPSEMEGEGNKTAARRYNRESEDFAESGEVERAADEAEDALDSPEGGELKRAEDEGRSKARS